MVSDERFLTQLSMSELLRTFAETPEIDQVFAYSAASDLRSNSRLFASMPTLPLLSDLPD